MNIALNKDHTDNKIQVNGYNLNINKRTTHATVGIATAALAVSTGIYFRYQITAFLKPIAEYVLDRASALTTVIGSLTGNLTTAGFAVSLGIIMSPTLVIPVLILVCCMDFLCN